MSKTIFTIYITDEAKVRKRQPKPTAVMCDKKKYTRKAKHKKGWDANPGLSFF